jgi:hypothetical protein
MKRIAEEYAPYTVDELLLPHTMGRGFFFYPERLPFDNDRSYDSNASFWKDVLTERMVAERTVVLRGFKIFEWFPRNPGLFHTPQAESAREMAQQYIRYATPGKHVGGFLSNSLDHAEEFRSITEGQGSARELIYTPQGKVSMLQGGVGCVRLRPIELKKGGQFWFMCATSSKAPDEGIPLLVAGDVYQTLIDEVRAKGYARRGLAGKAKFVREEFRDLYSKRNGIPRLYLEIVDIPRPVNSGKDQDQLGEVSVAASFLSEFQGYPRIYASYVTFDPGRQGARQSATLWMKQEYIEGLYQGSVLTDFDQQAPSIAETLFGLDQVLTSPDLAKQIAILKKKYGYFDWDMLEKSTLSFSTYEENVMVNINASGQGNIINIAKYMTDVSNTVNRNVEQSSASSEVKELIKSLASEVTAVGPKIDPALAEQMGKNLEALSKEVNSAKPQKKWYDVSLDGLKEAAQAVGELGAPILQTVSKLIPLLLS